ncbi:HTH_Tnp_Tc3_2 domain-containing protein [Trichonephila clavipes]|nr:HTH_Tnp_Tc3_2 domain-containing protein [Trichonephila clavipes]
MWSMVAHRLTQITPPAAPLDQLRQRVEAAWSAVPPKHIRSVFESMPRRVAGVMSNNGGYSDSEEVNEMNHAAPVPMSSRMRNIIKCISSYLDASSMVKRITKWTTSNHLLTI